ncbi:hypothetical protein L2E82_15485 [Cichorium intybus]|uniref:Uncharacterized protein n=1 Tax=Cichorium intybus TaxID=13427 RepID=A0ACB9F2W8_CICIN|nr:hypothetical protein L2E82_15485 [Cichorium intybus]
MEVGTGDGSKRGSHYINRKGELSEIADEHDGYNLQTIKNDLFQNKYKFKLVKCIGPRSGREFTIYIRMIWKGV